MSDSELSSAAIAPADSEMEQCLRRVVRNAQKAGEEVTVNLARSRAESELGLDAGFLKSEEWKARSKALAGEAFNDPPTPEQPKKSAPKSKAKPAATAGKKRKSDEAQPKGKRQKKSVTPEDEDEGPAPKQAANKKSAKSEAAVSESEDEEVEERPKPSVQADEDETSALSEPPETDDVKDEVPKTNGKPAADDDESDMSSVIDEPLPKKKRQKKSTSPADTKSKGTKSAKPAKATKELTPDEEEIKRLQGWLLKCGVRKVWHWELAKCDTTKQKIKHLKGMLEEVGMTGRYSVEKARQIKESRELAAELEAAKEFNDQWGQKKDSGGESEEEEPKEEVKMRRLKPKGLIDFGDSGDEE